jgi:deoxyribose-phosphate aldolase
MSKELDAVVDRIVERVRARLLEEEGAAPLPAVRGSWQDESAARLALGVGVVRLGTDGTDPIQGTPPKDLAKLIDHTLLKPTATRKDIERVCAEARKYGFASVCLNTTWIGLAARLLAGSGVMPICVVGFPLGAMSTAGKADETRHAIAAGAAEIDMVLNIGALKGGDYDTALYDIRQVVAAAQGRPVKVILETSMLSRDEKVAASALCKAGGAAFVKTSTGFGGGGATVEDIALIRAVVGPDMGIKASGGVKTAQDIKDLVAAGATRVGASASVAIVTGGAGKGGY